MHLVVMYSFKFQVLDIYKLLNPYNITYLFILDSVSRCPQLSSRGDFSLSYFLKYTKKKRFSKTFNDKKLR